MKNFLFLLIAIVSEVIATSALKASHEFTKIIPSVVTVVMYAVAFYFLSLTLRTHSCGNCLCHLVGYRNRIGDGCRNSCLWTKAGFTSNNRNGLHCIGCGNHQPVF